jgi:hypothetical protein
MAPIEQVIGNSSCLLLIIAWADLWMRAGILSYSRSRGLFAGISLEGSTLRPDNKANARIYGRKITAKAILLGNRVSIPATGRHLVRVLQTNAPQNESKQVASRSPIFQTPVVPGKPRESSQDSHREGESVQSNFLTDKMLSTIRLAVRGLN